MEAKVNESGRVVRRGGPAPSRSNIRAVLGVLFALGVAALGIVLDKLDISIVDTLDRFVGDYRVALLSPAAKEQRRDIAVVLVTEDTLLDYESRSPVDRGLIAELIRAIDAAGPKAIGLDFIFDRRTSKDAALIDAIRSAKAPVILGAIDNRVLVPEESLKIQSEILAAAGRPFGHYILERKTGFLAGRDSTVRLVGAQIEPGPEPFSAVVARTAGYPHRPPNNIIAWQRPPPDQDLFAEIGVPRHDPAEVKTVVERAMKAIRELLKDRIVLVGGSMIDRDRHTTPLTVLDDIPVHGVFIQAQAITQRIDGDRDIFEWSTPLMFAAAATVAILGYFAARALRVRLRRISFFYDAAGLVVLALLSFAAFWRFHIDLPSIALATAWVGGTLGGRYSHWLLQPLGLER